jgi:glycosyltransferase involved in cell wall biosynthesis
MNEIALKVVVPFYNVETWISRCIQSIQDQEYRNFACILIDDLSTDGSTNIIREQIAGDDRFTLIHNEQKKFALKNIHHGINALNPNNEDVIVTLDGDDWFAHNNVFSSLNAIYQKEGCWLTYGSYAEYPGGEKGIYARLIPDDVLRNNTFRDVRWMTSHLRTFKYHLFKQIDPADFLDIDGEYYTMTYDMALMFPMLEMAGSKIRYIDEILYIYNRTNPLNEDKVEHSLQLKLEKRIRSKKRYKRLVPEQ